MFCNVKTKFVFLFKHVKFAMTRVCFKVQVMSNYNMNTTVLSFKQVYIKEFIFEQHEIHII
jgi:hypothetical protein